MSLIGDIGDPVKDAAAIKPIVDAAVAKILDTTVKTIIPGLRDALVQALDGLTVNVVVTKNEIRKKEG